MKAHSLSWLPAVLLALFIGACSKKVDVNSSASELEKAFQAPAAPAAGQAANAGAAPTAPAEAQELVKTALTAARADDYAGGVIALQAAQRKPGVSADQLMAVQRTKQAMTAALVNRAANGDQNALAQLKAIERTRSQ